MNTSKRCGVLTKRGKPCGDWPGHDTREYYPTPHRAGESKNEDTPKLNLFKKIVTIGLDHGILLSYVEIAEIMDHPNVRSVAQYGLGARYTRLRQKMYKEAGLKAGTFQPRTIEQSTKIIADVKGVLHANP